MWERNREFRWILPAALVPILLVIIIGFQFSVPLEKAETSAEETDLQEATEHMAKLEPIEESGVTGQAMFTDPQGEGTFKVQLNAKGLGEGEHPQHIHENAECSAFGGVLTPLIPYPKATGGGTINYQSQEIEKPDSLADRTVVVHANDGTPVACGEIDPVSN